MSRWTNISYLMVLAVTLTGCQKAKLTHRRPTPEVTQLTVPGPVPEEPNVIPLPPTKEPRHEDDDFEVTPIPPPPIFVPRPETPIDEDGRQLDPDIFSPEQQTGIQPPVYDPNIVEWFESGYLKPELKKCGPNCDPPPPKKPAPPKKQDCSPIQLPSAPLTDKLDILFVVDTSASLKEERSLIASQMGAFIDHLEPNVDYQMAVMAAHGPQSPHKIHGQLFSTHIGDPAVIRYRGVQGKRGVIKDLQDKMLHLPNDSSSAQGEVGLLSVYNAMTQPTLLRQIKRQGFLRDNAALAVIFVSDENDACYDYANGGKPNYDGSGKRDPVEQKTFDTICRLNGRTQLAPKHVLQALQKVKGKMPLILTGILYTSEKIPHKKDKYAQENEKGRGYLDLIYKAYHGRAVDIGQKNFGASLADLGIYSQFRMSYDNSFICKTSVSANKVNLDSFQITLSSKKGKLLGRFTSSCARKPSTCPKGVPPARARVDSSGRQVEVYLSFVEFQKIAQPSAVVRMSFMTK